jgi:O-methyltransferase involved in polyketide biosynthesis
VNPTLPALTPVQASLYLTLCGRALDSRARHSFLADPTGTEIATRLGYGCSGFPMPASSVTDIALRSKKLDDVVRRFVAAHLDAVVLDLGAGLDGRMVRVAPPDTVVWYDVDFPAVIALRTEVLPPRPNAHPSLRT